MLNLYDVLRGLGHAVFLDQYAIAPGDDLTRKLEDALTASQAGVLVGARLTRDSDWVRREYDVMERQATRKKGFQLVPVKLDSSPLPAFAENRLWESSTSWENGIRRRSGSMAGRGWTATSSRETGAT